MKRLILSSLLLTALPAFAQVSVGDPWVRATVPQQKATGAFMQITAAQDARLLGAKSAVAGAVEIHEMKMDKDVMRMRAMTNGLDLPAGKAVELKPGGLHIMLMDLKQQVKVGDTIPLTLLVEGKDKKQTSIEVNAPVKPLAEVKAMDHGHKH